MTKLSNFSTSGLQRAEFTLEGKPYKESVVGYDSVDEFRSLQESLYRTFRCLEDVTPAICTLHVFVPSFWVGIKGTSAGRHWPSLEATGNKDFEFRRIL